MTDPIDLQAARAKREEARERAEIRREGFASSNPAIQELAFSIANEDWGRLERLLADDDDVGSVKAGYLVLTIDRAEDVASAEPDHLIDIARMLAAAADHVEQCGLPEARTTLCDAEGQCVGNLQLMDDAPIGDPVSERGGPVARLVVASSDAVASHMRQAAARVARGDNLFTLRGDDGAVIGKFEWRESLQTRELKP